MALAHSRGTSCAAPRCVPRITSCDSFGTQCRCEPGPNILNVFPTISCFFDILFGSKVKFHRKSLPDEKKIIKVVVRLVFY